MAKARILTEAELAIASDAIKAGDIVAIPTETVYGLAGDAFNASAVTKIFAAKARPSFDPLIVHVPLSLNSVGALADRGIIDDKQLSNKVIQMTDQLISNFWPGPLTIILPKGRNIPDIVTSGLPSVGVRMPSHSVAQKILTLCDTPLAAPSANRFGRISPTQSSHVLDELGDSITYVVEGGPSDVGVESTVIAVGEGPSRSGSATIWLIRPGKITAHDLQPFSTDPIEIGPTEHEKASPGMLMSHYAPMKPLVLLDDSNRPNQDIQQLIAKENRRVGLLVPHGDGAFELSRLAEHGCRPIQTIYLSQNRDDQEAAKNLFAAMRKLDAMDINLIIAGPVPTNTGLWLAISDRLKRAAIK